MGRTDANAASGDEVEELRAALGTFSAEELRGIVFELLHGLDDRARARALASLVARAARTGSGWAPPPVDDAQVAAVLAFVRLSERVGHAEPSIVDAHLRCGSAAFLSGDHATAHRIFGALFPPILQGGFDLGQEELVDEVLGTDLVECAAQYVVAAYLHAPPASRAEAVLEAMEIVHDIGNFWAPLRELERVALEPLPGWQDFLPRWRELVAGKVAGQSDSAWASDAERWLREAVQRIEGVGGLATLARTTKRVDDLRAWCGSLVAAREWTAAQTAYEEAAALAMGDVYARGEFLDGAALAARESGHEQLAPFLERAWRASPSMLRLRRWLGAAKGAGPLAKRSRVAIEACPAAATKQRALLHLLLHEFDAAAKLLAQAPGLGWSDAEHPGLLLVPLFEGLLGEERRRKVPRGPTLPRGLAIDELGAMMADPGVPRIEAPEVEALLERAGVARIEEPAVRQRVRAAMRQAAERRLAGVTSEKRRRQYVEAAELVATCVRSDETGEAARWATAITVEYKRFPALREALVRAVSTR